MKLNVPIYHMIQISKNEIPYILFSSFASLRDCQVKTRKIHKISITDFKEDILNFDLIKHPHRTASLLSHQYFNTLHGILDKHAPIKRKMAPVHPDKGFVNSDILSAKRLKRKCERVWRSNNSAINRRRYQAAVNRYNFLLEQSRHRHYSTVIAENNDNPPRLCGTLSRKSCTKPQPSPYLIILVLLI